MSRVPPHYYVLLANERVEGRVVKLPGRVEGRVVKLPGRGDYQATRLWLKLDDGRSVSIAATACRGHTVLERELEHQAVGVNDRISITYHRMREDAGVPECHYRFYTVRVAR